MQFPEYYTYPVYTLVIALGLIALVPRKDIKRLAIYGIIFGGVSDIIVIAVAKIFSIGSHVNFGPFGMFDLSFFPPLAWSIWFIMYLYFLPNNRILQTVYILAAAGYAMFFSNVLLNYNVLEWHKGRIFVPFLLYLVWFTLATWIYPNLVDWLGKSEG